MTKPRTEIDVTRAGVWRSAIVVVMIALIGPAIGFAAGVRSGRASAPYVFEVLLLGGALVAVSESRIMIAYLTSLRPAERAGAKLIFVVLLLVQGIGSYSLTVPLIPWTMYEGGHLPPQLVTLYECVGETPTGQVVRLNPSQLFRSNGMGTRRMANKLIVMIEGAKKASADLSALDVPEVHALHELLLAIAEKHNSDNPSQPIHALCVIESHVDWRRNGKPVKSWQRQIVRVPINANKGADDT